ncbi:uncharacterized protein Z518_06048 [Rhinocladiella mackenziei CBS 650.93]|uniref:Uncharacterized protein n=1 Tax=Rhinocladiella mackenziei CBS 650.93 TaxID=1442369 RepID=A0A0D2IPR9_9EURO|nr:uncharacterized protein Z518_06048 [Rhinocladiella mackenziei CBS 650.93]KIX05176.1 hypothetical protein Z518_06048 [Rhinocladiella mackenziei CBS 650.93]
MLFKHAITALLSIITCAVAVPVERRLAPNETVTYLGSQSRILSGGATAKGLVYTAGTVPSLNGTIVSGGIQNQTAQVIRNIGAILEEAGTSWDYVLKTTVYLATMDDYSAMNEVYAEMLPDPKPARTAVEVGQLPGNFSIEMEAIAAIPWW